MKRVVVFFADGMEECEALLIVDILRRAGIETVTASVNGTQYITSSHKVEIKADATAEDIDYNQVDMIVLPGGMPGTVHLSENSTVRKQSRIFTEKKMIAAICAAPSVLAELGLLQARKAVCYPSFKEYLVKGGAEFTDDGVVSDGNIVTARALGSAIPFALEIVRKLVGIETADSVSHSICF